MSPITRRLVNDARGVLYLFIRSPFLPSILSGPGVRSFLIDEAVDDDDLSPGVAKKMQ